MFSLRFTVVLLLILIVPLMLRLRNLEPYPAVLFPSGAGVLKHKADKTVDTESKVLMGLKPDGKWEELEIKTFLQPASIQNLTPLININFGLEEKKLSHKPQKFKLIKELLNFERHPLSEKNARTLRAWLNSRLVQQGYVSNYIKVYSFTRTISTQTGTVVNKRIKDEKIIAFAK